MNYLVEVRWSCQKVEEGEDQRGYSDIQMQETRWNGSQSAISCSQNVKVRNAEAVYETR